MRIFHPRFPGNSPGRFGRIVALSVVGALLTLASVASADRPYRRNQSSAYDFARPGFYVGGGLVGGFTTQLEGELTDAAGGPDVDVDPSVGLAATVGFRIAPHFAVEAHYEWMNDFETSVGGRDIAETETSTLTGNVKGYLATGQVQPYLSAGVGFLRATSENPASTFQRTDTDFALRFGGGIDFYITENVGISADTSYIIPTGDVEDLDHLSVGAGVFFRF